MTNAEALNCDGSPSAMNNNQNNDATETGNQNNDATETDKLLRNQWLVNIGGTLTPQAECPADTPQCRIGSGEQRVFITGGLVVPLPVVIISLFGAAISLSRRVPEIQKQSESDYVSTEKHPALTLTEAREYLAFQIMQFMSAPLIAITAYQVIAPTNEASTIALAFLAGFGSESILLLIRGVAEGIQPKDAGTAAAERLGSVEGLITAKGQPISADVTVRGTNLKAKSDAQGKYVIKQVPAGLQILSVLNNNTIQTRDVAVIAGATIPCDIDIAGNGTLPSQPQLPDAPAPASSAISAPITVDIRMAIDMQGLDPGTVQLSIDNKSIPVGDDGMVEFSVQPGRPQEIKASATRNGVGVSGKRIMTFTLDDDGSSFSFKLE